MFDYERLKKTAYRFKYETVFETEDGRTRYVDFLTRVNSVYNALLRLNLGGGKVMLFARTSPDAVSVAFACDRAGYTCVIADEKLPLFAVEQAVKMHQPALCIGEGRELFRISGRLAECGCKAVLVTDFAPLPALFPTEYRLDELIAQNDYTAVNIKDKKGTFLFALSDDTLLPDMTFARDIKPREGIVADLPFYTRAGALALCELIYGCHRLCFCDLDAKKLKKKKISTLVTAGEIPDGVGVDAVRLKCSEMPYIGGGVFDIELVRETLCKTVPLPLKIETDGKKIHLSVILDGDAEMDKIQHYPPVQALKSVAKEVLYPYNVHKTFTFTQKTN